MIKTILILCIVCTVHAQDLFSQKDIPLLPKEQGKSIDVSSMGTGVRIRILNNLIVDSWYYVLSGGKSNKLSAVIIVKKGVIECLNVRESDGMAIIYDVNKASIQIFSDIIRDGDLPLETVLELSRKDGLLFIKEKQIETDFVLVPHK